MSVEKRNKRKAVRTRKVTQLVVAELEGIPRPIFPALPAHSPGQSSQQEVQRFSGGLLFLSLKDTQMASLEKGCSVDLAFS